MAVPLKNAFLQSNFDAKNFTILNLDLSGLNLVKGSVGLGNVDNTSDLAKPVSTATAAALALKEGAITPGTTSQFWRGDKTFVNYGALALQNGDTSLSLISVIGADATSGAVLYAKRSDGVAHTSISHGGASQAGFILGGGIAAANAGALVFTGAAYGVIKTTNSSPLYFGTNSLLRMQLLLGLNIGGTIDPGQGCLSVLFDASAGRDVSVGRNLAVTGELLVSGALAHVVGDLQVDGDIVSSGDLSAATLFAPSITGNAFFAPLTTPASAGAAGAEGKIAWDANYIYIWTATNTVKRVAIATWP